MTPPLPAHPLPLQPDQIRISGTPQRPGGALLPATTAGGASDFAFLTVFEGAVFEGAVFGGAVLDRPEPAPPTPQITDSAVATDQDGRKADTSTDAAAESTPHPADGAARQLDPAPLPFWASADQRHPVQTGTQGTDAASGKAWMQTPEIVTNMAEITDYPQTAKIAHDDRSGHLGDTVPPHVTGQGNRAAHSPAHLAANGSVNPLAPPAPPDRQLSPPAAPLHRTDPTALILLRSGGTGTVAMTPAPDPVVSAIDTAAMASTAPAPGPAEMRGRTSPPAFVPVQPATAQPVSMTATTPLPNPVPARITAGATALPPLPPPALPKARTAPLGPTVTPDAPNAPAPTPTGITPLQAQRAAPPAFPQQPAAPIVLAGWPRSDPNGEHLSVVNAPRPATAPHGHATAPVLTGPQPAPQAPFPPPDAAPAATDALRTGFTPFPDPDLRHAVDPVAPASARDQRADGADQFAPKADAAPISRSLLALGLEPGTAQHPKAKGAELHVPATMAPDQDAGRIASPAAANPSLPSGPDAATRVPPSERQAFPSRQPMADTQNQSTEPAPYPQRQASNPDNGKPPIERPAATRMPDERPAPTAAPVPKASAAQGSAPWSQPHPLTSAPPLDPRRPEPSAPPKPSVVHTALPSVIDPHLPPMPRIDGGSGQSGTPSATLSPPTALPDLMARQILPNLATPGVVSVTLTPIDLGTLQFEVTPKGDSLHLHLTVDLPATLDLLRRQGDQLIAELRQAGFANATLSFAASDGHPGNSHSGQGQPQGEGRYPPLAKAPTLSPSPEDRAPEIHHPLRAPSGALDLRL